MHLSTPVFGWPLLPFCLVCQPVFPSWLSAVFLLSLRSWSEILSHLKSTNEDGFAADGAVNRLHFEFSILAHFFAFDSTFGVSLAVLLSLSAYEGHGSSSLGE